MRSRRGWLKFSKQLFPCRLLPGLGFVFVSESALTAGDQLLSSSSRTSCGRNPRPAKLTVWVSVYSLIFYTVDCQITLVRFGGPCNLHSRQGEHLLSERRLSIQHPPDASYPAPVIKIFSSRCNLPVPFFRNPDALFQASLQAGSIRSDWHKLPIASFVG